MHLTKINRIGLVTFCTVLLILILTQIIVSSREETEEISPPPASLASQKENLTKDENLSKHNSSTLSQVLGPLEISPRDNNAIDDIPAAANFAILTDKDKEFLQYIENEIITDLINDGPADLQSLPSYALVLTSKVSWLRSHNISGKQLVANAFAGIKENVKLNPEMSSSDLQYTCISAIAKYTDKLLLEVFYSSANIPVIDIDKLSISTKQINNDTYCIYVKSGFRPKPLRFFITAAEYKNNFKNAQNRCLAQAAKSIRLRKAKDFLINQLPPVEASNLARQQSFGEKELLGLVRNKYEIAVEVPEYRVLDLIDKAQRVFASKNIRVRPRM